MSIRRVVDIRDDKTHSVELGELWGYFARGAMILYRLELDVNDEHRQRAKRSISLEDGEY